MSARRGPEPDTTGEIAAKYGPLLLLLAATAIFLWLAFLLLQPFLAPLTWAFALAVVGAPLNRWICGRSRHPNAAAAISVLIVACVIVAPILLLSQQLVRETTSAVQKLQAEGDLQRMWRSAGERQPWLQPVIQWAESIQPGKQLQEAAGGLFKQLSSIVSASLWAIAQLLITLFALFYFFRDRGPALKTIMAITPLTDGEIRKIARRVADTVEATVYGTLVVAAVQGALGGLMFWWLGLPAPVLWGVAMGVLAIVPVLGAFVIWVPAAIWLAIEGLWFKAIVLTAWGTVVVGTIDNLLYPVLVGARLHFHTLLMFIAVVGGLMVFGAAGLILGPAILAITAALIDIWQTRSAGQSSPA